MADHPELTPEYFKLDRAISRELRAAAEREKRTKRAIVELALADYFAKGGTVVKPAPSRGKLCHP